MPPDILLAHARQELEGFPLSILERYVGFTGLDATEYGVLVSILTSLVGSSPPQDKLITARALFVTTASGVPKNSNIPVPSIWNTPPVAAWYQYAVLKTTPYPPSQMVRLSDWNSAMRAQAVDLDVRALAQKIKRYLNDAPNILQSVCRQEGLEVSKAGGDENEQRQTHGITSTRLLDNDRDHVEFRPNLEVFVGRKRTRQAGVIDKERILRAIVLGRKRPRQAADLEEEEPAAARVRVQDGEEHHDEENDGDDEHNLSSSSTISAHSMVIDKPDRSEEDMQQARTASKLLARQLFSSESEEDAQTSDNNEGTAPDSNDRMRLATPTVNSTQARTASQHLARLLFSSDNEEDSQTSDNNRGTTPDSSDSIKLDTPSASATQDPTLSPEEPPPSAENSFMSVSPRRSIDVIDLTSDSPSSAVAEPFNEWQNVDEGSRSSETPRPTPAPIQEVIMIDDDSDDEVMPTQSINPETLEELAHAGSPFFDIAEWIQDVEMHDANHQPREPSENMWREPSAYDSNDMLDNNRQSREPYENEWRELSASDANDMLDANHQPREPAENEWRELSASVADEVPNERTVEVIVLDSDSDDNEDQVQQVQSAGPATPAMLHKDESPESNTNGLTQYNGPHDIHHQPHESSANEWRGLGAPDADGYREERKGEVIVIDSDSDDNDEQLQRVQSAGSATQAVLHKAESPISDTNEPSQYDGPHDINHQPHELPANELRRFSGLPISPYCSWGRSSVYAGEVDVRACMCARCRSQLRGT